MNPLPTLGFGMMAGFPATLAVPPSESLPLPSSSPSMGGMMGLSGGGAAFDASTSPPGMSIGVPPSRASFAAAFGDREGEQKEEMKEREKEKEKEKASLYWPWGAVPSPPPVRPAGGGTEAQEAHYDSVENISTEPSIPEATGTTTSLVGQQQEGGGVRDIDSVSTSSSDDSSSRSSSPGLPASTAAAASKGIRSPVPIPIPVQRPSATMMPSSPPSLWTRTTSYVGRDVPSHTPTPPRGVVGGVVEDGSTTDSVYQAFVRKWCFAHEGLKG